MSFVQSIHDKIQPLRKTLNYVSGWKLCSERIVFTNGCFDILHKGHIEYLLQAADQGDRLVVGLNSDASVKKLNKGSGRPIQDEESRALVLASLAVVSMVVLFDEETPEKLIEEIQPDMLVKGGDYEISQIAGAEGVLKNGGEVKTIPLIPNYSTSNIESKIRGQAS